MLRGRRTWGLVAVLVPLLGGDLALQVLGGGIRGQSLSPAVLALVLGVLGVVIVVHRPQVRLGPLLLVNSLGFGVGALGSGVLDYASAHPLPRLLANATFHCRARGS